jgi:hypothetical protein
MAFFRLSDLYLTLALSGLTGPTGLEAFPTEKPNLELVNSDTPLSDQTASLNPELSPISEPAKKSAPKTTSPVFAKPSLKSLILAERGLLFAEMSLLAENNREFLLETAVSVWNLAELESPGSSRYSRARWAAWTENPETLAPFLAHTVDEQTNLLWPSLSEARLEPAFRNLIDQPWFKSAWFSYSR